MRADRLDERTAENVATASTSVPAGGGQRGDGGPVRHASARPSVGATVARRLAHEISFAHSSRMGSTTSAGGAGHAEDALGHADGREVLELARVGDRAERHDLEGGRIAPGLARPRGASSGMAVRQAGAADRHPAVGVLGDVARTAWVRRAPPISTGMRPCTGLGHDQLGERWTWSPSKDGHLVGPQRLHGQHALAGHVAPIGHGHAVVGQLVLVPAEARRRAPPARPTRWSRVATALAVTMGSRWAGRAMPVPRRMRSVTAAAAARATNGSSVRLYSSGSSAVAGRRRACGGSPGCGCARAGRASRSHGPRPRGPGDTTSIVWSVANMVIPWRIVLTL